MVLTDPNLVKLTCVQTVTDSLDKEGVAYTLYDQVRVEPTDTSFKDAIKEEMHAKTGIANRLLKPTLGIVGFLHHLTGLGPGDRLHRSVIA